MSKLEPSLCFDIETSADKTALATMPEPEVALGNLKDPEKIAAKIAEAKVKQVERAALDPFTSRVLAIGMIRVPLLDKEDGELVPADVLVRERIEDQDKAERILIQALWSTLIGKYKGRAITFNGAGFDIPYLVTRCLILHIRPPKIETVPWKVAEPGADHWDLYQTLKTVDACGDHPRKLGFYVDRFLPTMQRDYPADLNKTDFASQWEKGDDSFKTVAAWDVRATGELAEYLWTKLAGGSL